ncbi:MAG TPA: hemolysin family protein [Acidimicrobiales bacterium]|nr:hemolysin family protein [Acidimicrobiales bacterium]
MTTGDVIALAFIVVNIAVLALLALSETALTSTSRIRAITMAEEGRRGADRLAWVVERKDRVINPLLFTILVCQTAAAYLVGSLADKWFGALGALVGLVFEIAVVFVFAEAAPKTWALQNPDRAALLAAGPSTILAKFAPLRMITRGLIGLTNVILPGKGLKEGPFVSEEDLLATVDVATEEEVIESEERALIRSIIEFGDTVAREVMVPRPDMVAVASRDRITDVLEVAIAAGYSRIPVYGQGIDDIVGIVYTKDLMKAVQEQRGDGAVSDLVREAQFVPEFKRVAELMREMQGAKFHMAIVVDEYGGTAGLVTLEDLIEELVGEIVDEFDVEEPNVEALPGGAVRVNARMPIDEVNELIDAEFPEGDWDTIGGFVFNLLGHVPAEGETADYDGHRLTAEKVQGRRIGRIRINPA